jgi:hypothetical protein
MHDLCIKNPRFRPIADQETRVKQEWIAALWADSRQAAELQDATSLAGGAGCASDIRWLVRSLGRFT